ncbi:MAG: energy transducer TonB [Sterolibacterium sp.]|nr:energy transducer TonB [Sterolibacterium sp.]
MKYTGQRKGPTNHLVGFGIVVLLHVVTAYALMSGLARKVVEVVKAPIETKIIEETQKTPEVDEPPPPPPKLAPPPPPYIPPPEVNIAVQPTTAPSNAITVVTTEKPKEAPPPPQPAAPPKPAVRTAPVIDAARSCEKPEYPAASKRMEEEGTVTLNFLIDVDGKVIDSRVEKSSGYARLDQAARTALGKCKFKPGTVDGKPEQSWASIKYTWQLEDW